MDAMLQDFRYAVRSLSRARGFTVAAAVALALGIGATSALFSVVWAVLLKPLPYHDPDRLVAILHGDEVNSPVSPADYLDLRRAARSFASMAAAQAWSANLAGDGRAERVPALQVTPGLFHLLGVQPALGRVLRRVLTTERAMRFKSSSDTRCGRAASAPIPASLGDVFG